MHEAQGVSNGLCISIKGWENLWLTKMVATYLAIRSLIMDDPL